MRLSEFILSNLESIMVEWESFASTVLPKSNIGKLALRDEAEDILKAIATDMETEQTASEQAEKSKGRGPRTQQDTAAEIHGHDRFRLGFNQAQVVAEYRALRATVLRLWAERSPKLDESTVDQLIRFDEGIDQALSESTARFMQYLEHSMNLATAVLTHDLRNPLNAILWSAQFLLRSEGFDRAAINALASTIFESGTQMGKLIENLRDFTRTQLGEPLPLKRSLIDLTTVCQQIAAQFTAAYPQRKIRFNYSGDVHGNWDGTRMAQLVSNLISNAIEHGAQNEQVTVNLYGESEEVVLEVHNVAPPIPQSDLDGLFNPLSRLTRHDTAGENDESHFGLGLFVTREIVEAHSAKITVSSTTEGGTTFMVRLPRRAAERSA